MGPDVSPPDARPRHPVSTAFREYCSAERIQRGNADAPFDAPLFDEAVEYAARRLRHLEESAP